MSVFLAGMLAGAGVMVVRDLITDALLRRELRDVEARVRREREWRREQWGQR